KSGAGTVILAGTNSYTGGTSINAGAVSVSSDANLGDLTRSVTIASGAKLATTADFFSNRQVQLRAPGGITQPDGTTVSGVLDVAGGTQLELRGQILGQVPSSRLMKTGAGTLFLNNTQF